MHFSIPDTQEFRDENSTAYTAFNMHVNGVFHCTVRYRQLHFFHEQIKKEFSSLSLPPFPPKKLLGLNATQLDDRRLMLERYIQIVSQEPTICNSDIFNGFLLSAQQETQKQEPESVSLDVFLMNGHKIVVNIMSTDQTEDVMENVASQVQLSDDFVYYFALYLVKKEGNNSTSIVRKLQDFESPYISLKSTLKHGNHRIVLRKSFWDSSYDDDLLDDRVAMNLLYVQAVSDVERQWILASKEQLKQLTLLQQKGSKREYLRLARTLRYYGYIHFINCMTDFPQANCKVLLAAGNKELSFRIETEPNCFKEGVFKITRMRCWRITTTVPDAGAGGETAVAPSKLEISFEYLIAKEKLQWITITSEQAILLSMSLQGMVDELLMRKEGRKIKKPQDRLSRRKRNFLRRNQTANGVSSSQLPADSDEPSGLNKAMDSVKKISEKLTSHSSQKLNIQADSSVTENDAFEGIGDDDL